MRLYLVPLLSFAVIVSLYFALSDAPERVDMLSLAVLAIALPLAAIWAATRRSLVSRWVICACSALAAILVWDVAVYLIGFKIEPFMIVRSTPAVYLVWVVIAAFVGFLLSWLARPPGEVGARG